MSPTSHLLASWITGVSFRLTKRDVRIVSLVGLIPDLDGFGYFIDKINLYYGKSSYFYSEYHHVILHGILPALLISVFAMLLSKSKKFSIFFVSLFVYHLHLLCDLIGSGGSGNNIWPIIYFYPFNKTELSISWQWLLNGWQNLTIAGILIIISIYLSSKIKHSPIGVVSIYLDKEMFNIFKK